jgi:hypothetical protein
MPSLRNSLVELDPKKYQRLEPGSPVARPEPFRPSPAPEPPLGMRRSTVMISSLPIISVNVDGVIRQFYGHGNFPSRRLVSP